APGGIVVDGPLQGLYFGAGGAPAQLNYGSLVSSPYMVGGDWQYTDYARELSLLPRMERRSLFTHLSYDLTESLQVQAQVSYGDAHSWGFSGPQTNFNGIAIRQDNAFLPAEVAAQMASLGLDTIRVGFWNKDRRDARVGESESDREQLRVRLGLVGEAQLFGSGWDWEFSVQRGVNHIYNDIEVPIVARFNEAIDAVRAPNGAIVCRSTLDNPNNGCVPYNIIGYGVGTREAMNYFMGLSWMENRFTQDV